MYGAADVERIARYLDALEAKSGMPQGSVKLAIVATETPKAMFTLGSYAPAHPRLVGLTWGAEDLAAALGATDNKEADGFIKALRHERPDFAGLPFLMGKACRTPAKRSELFQATVRMTF